MKQEISACQCVPGDAEGWSAPVMEETGMWSRNDFSAWLQYSPAAAAATPLLPPAFPAASLAISVSLCPSL